MREVVAENLTVEYELIREKETLVALWDINLKVKAGEFLVIVGPSGCGKTTFINVVVGLVPPSGGQVLVGGQPVTGPGPDRAMVFQDYALMPWRTFEESLPHELSGGMRQRVGLARALATEPEVLLLDEPFGALDAMTREVMQAEFEKILSRTSQTVIFITHSIDEAITMGDRIVVMTAGPGRIKAILDNDIPRPRWKADVRGYPRYHELREEIWHLLQAEQETQMISDRSL
ncbi:MAG: ABC transporter ATP-binding protein [Anaerolineae bacterium]